MIIYYYKDPYSTTRMTNGKYPAGFFLGGAEVFQPLSFSGVHVHEYDLASI